MRWSWRVLLIGLAGMGLLATILLLPSIAGHLLTEDGVIHNPGARFWLWNACIVAGSLSIAALLMSAIVGDAKIACRSLWRNLSIFTICALLTVGSALALRVLLIFRAGNIQLEKHLDFSEAIVEEAYRSRQDQEALRTLGSLLLNRASRTRLRPEALWSFEPEELAAHANAILSGRFGDVYEVEADGWLPGQPLDIGAYPKALQFQIERHVFLHYLVAGAARDRQGEVATYLRRFLQAWEDSEAGRWYARPWAWADDPMANRAEAREHAMRYLREVGQSSPGKELTHLEWTIRHARKLMDDDLHTTHSNHGLMQNSALLLLGIEHPELRDSELWIETAIARTRKYLDENVTSKGVLLELTPFYHHYSTTKLIWFYTTCSSSGYELGERYEEKLRKMVVFYHSIMYPDGTFPKIADTYGRRPDLREWPWTDLPDWKELHALRQSLKDAAKPVNSPGARFWDESGYLILRPSNDPYDLETATMITMMLGRASLSHNHMDKLSMTLFGHGRPLLIGPGYPSYFDPTRRAQLISTPSQNTLSVDGLSQRIGGVETVVSDVLGDDDDVELLLAVGVSRLYDGVEHSRTLAFGPEKWTFLLIDQVKSTSVHEYSIPFRVADFLTKRTTPEGARVLDENDPLLEVRFLPWDDAGVKIEAEGPSVSASAHTRNWTIVTILDLTPGIEEGVISMRDESLIWRGPRGILTLPREQSRAGDYQWRRN